MPTRSLVFLFAALLAVLTLGLNGCAARTGPPAPIPPPSEDMIALGFDFTAAALDAGAAGAQKFRTCTGLKVGAIACRAIADGVLAEQDDPQYPAVVYDLADCVGLEGDPGEDVDVPTFVAGALDPVDRGIRLTLDRYGAQLGCETRQRLKAASTYLSTQVGPALIGELNETPSDGIGGWGVVQVDFGPCREPPLVASRAVLQLPRG